MSHKASVNAAPSFAAAARHRSSAPRHPLPSEFGVVCEDSAIREPHLTISEYPRLCSGHSTDTLSGGCQREGDGDAVRGNRMADGSGVLHRDEDDADAAAGTAKQETKSSGRRSSSGGNSVSGAGKTSRMTSLVPTSNAALDSSTDACSPPLDLFPPPRHRQATAPPSKNPSMFTVAVFEDDAACAVGSNNSSTSSSSRQWHLRSTSDLSASMSVAAGQSNVMKSTQTRTALSKTPTSTTNPSSPSLALPGCDLALDGGRRGSVAEGNTAATAAAPRSTPVTSGTDKDQKKIDEEQSGGREAHASHGGPTHMAPLRRSSPGRVPCIEFAMTGEQGELIPSAAHTAFTPTAAAPRRKRQAPPTLSSLLRSSEAELSSADLQLRDSFSAMAGASNTVAWSTPSSSFARTVAHDPSTLHPHATNVAHKGENSLTSSSSNTNNSSQQQFLDSYRSRPGSLCLPQDASPSQPHLQRVRWPPPRVDNGGLSDAAISPVASSAPLSLASTPTMATASSTPHAHHPGAAHASPKQPPCAAVLSMAKPNARLYGKSMKTRWVSSSGSDSEQSCRDPSPKSATATPQYSGLSRHNQSPVLVSRTARNFLSKWIEIPFSPNTELPSSPQEFSGDRVEVGARGITASNSQGERTWRARLQRTWLMVFVRFLAIAIVPHVCLWYLLPRVLPASAAVVAEEGVAAQPRLHLYAITRHHPELGLGLLELLIITVCVGGIVWQYRLRGLPTRSAEAGVRQQQQQLDRAAHTNQWILQPLLQQQQQQQQLQQQLSAACTEAMRSVVSAPVTPIDHLSIHEKKSGGGFPLRSRGPHHHHHHHHQYHPNLSALRPSCPASPITTSAFAGATPYSTPVKEGVNPSFASEGGHKASGNTAGPSGIYSIRLPARGDNVLLGNISNAGTPITGTAASPLLSFMSSADNNINNNNSSSNPAGSGEFLRRAASSRTPCMSRQSTTPVLAARANSSTCDFGSIGEAKEASGAPSIGVRRGSGGGAMTRGGSVAEAASESAFSALDGSVRCPDARAAVSAAPPPSSSPSSPLSSSSLSLAAAKPSFVPMGLGLGFLICTGLSTWRLSVDLYYAWFDFHYGQNAVLWFWLLPSSLIATAAFLFLLLGGHVHRYNLACQVRLGTTGDGADEAGQRRFVCRAAASSLQALRWLPWCGCCVPHPRPELVMLLPPLRTRSTKTPATAGKRARPPTQDAALRESRTTGLHSGAHVPAGHSIYVEGNDSCQSYCLSRSRSEYESEGVGRPRRSPREALLATLGDSVECPSRSSRSTDSCPPIHISKDIIVHSGNEDEEATEEWPTPDLRVHRSPQRLSASADFAVVPAVRTSVTERQIAASATNRLTQSSVNAYLSVPVLTADVRHGGGGSRRVSRQSSSVAGGSAVRRAGERAGTLPSSSSSIRVTLVELFAYWRDKLHIPDLIMRLRRLVCHRLRGSVCWDGYAAQRRDSSRGSGRRLTVFSVLVQPLLTSRVHRALFSTAATLSPSAYAVRLSRWNAYLSTAYLIVLVFFASVLASLLYFTWQWRIIVNRAASAAMFAVDTAAAAAAGTPVEAFPVYTAYGCSTKQHMVRFFTWVVPPVCVGGGVGGAGAGGVIESDAVAAWTVPNQVALLLTMLNTRRFEVAYLYTNVALPIGFLCVLYHLTQELRLYAQSRRLVLRAKARARAEKVRKNTEMLV